MKIKSLIIIGIVMMGTIPFVTFAALERYGNYLEQLEYERQRIDNDTPADRAGIKIEGKNKWITLIQNASNN